MPNSLALSPFTDDGRWYLKLIYKYEDNTGNKHTVVIPKASIPFSQYGFPYINNEPDYLNNKSMLNRPYINCDDSIPLYESVCDLTIGRGVKTPAYFFDIIKVKIINKEKNDGNGKKM